jgi:hypothetical protein
LPHNYKSSLKPGNVFKDNTDEVLLKNGVTYYGFLGRHCGLKDYMTNSNGSSKEMAIEKPSRKQFSPNH